MTAENIPDESWPRCRWCGDPLGELSLEVDAHDNQKLLVCENCRSVVEAVIAEYVPFFLSQFLGHYNDFNEKLVTYPLHRDLGPIDIEEIARKSKMKAKAIELT